MSKTSSEIALTYDKEDEAEDDEPDNEPVMPSFSKFSRVLETVKTYVMGQLTPSDFMDLNCLSQERGFICSLHF